MQVELEREVNAVQTLYSQMVESIALEREERGFLFYSVGGDAIWFMPLSELRATQGLETGIEYENYLILLETVESGYDFDTQFVYLHRLESDIIYYEIVVLSRDESRWEELITLQSIKQNRANKQKAIARAKLREMRRDRGKRSKRKGKR